MASEIRQKDNAGVHGGTGYEFQKHCALYLLLDDYDKLKSKDYFIYFEHFDDFVFCYTINGALDAVHLYQAKKNSTKWSLNKTLKDIMISMCEDGLITRSDKTFVKSTEYIQLLHFISNEVIELDKTNTNESKEINCFDELCSEAQESIIAHYKEIKKRAIYISLGISSESEIKDKEISDWYKSLDKNERQSIDDEIDSDPILAEIPNLVFRYIDLSRTVTAQKDQLKGKLSTLFKDQIEYPGAAIDALLLLFGNKATTFNQGCVTFANKSKRVSSGQVNEHFDIIAAKSLAIKNWRSRGPEMAQKIGLPLMAQKKFEATFTISFDLFKDITQAEHQKILELSRYEYETNTEICDKSSFVNIVFERYKAQYTSRLSDIDIKAVVYAAFFEITNPKGNE